MKLQLVLCVLAGMAVLVASDPRDEISTCLGVDEENKKNDPGDKMGKCINEKFSEGELPEGVVSPDDGFGAFLLDLLDHWPPATSCDKFKKLEECLVKEFKSCHDNDVLAVECARLAPGVSPPPTQPPPTGDAWTTDQYGNWPRVPLPCEDPVRIEKRDIWFTIGGFMSTHSFLCDNDQANLKKLVSNDTMDCIVKELNVHGLGSGQDTGEDFFETLEDDIDIHETDMEDGGWRMPICDRIAAFKLNKVETPLKKCGISQTFGGAVGAFFDHVCMSGASLTTSLSVVTLPLALLASCLTTHYTLH